MTIEATKRQIGISRVFDVLAKVHIEKHLPGEVPVLRQLQWENPGSADARLLSTVITLRQQGKMPDARTMWADAERMYDLPVDRQGDAYLAYHQRVFSDQSK